jgi:hypothetical protein
MLDKIFNPAPTIYKWDRFWVGFLPALLAPVFSFLVLYLIISGTSRYVHHEGFSFSQFLNYLQSPVYFLQISTLCCFSNGIIFFAFIKQNYNNSSRAVILTTMLYVIAIVIRDVS